MTIVNGNGARIPVTGVEGIRLELTVTDRDVIEELQKHSDPSERDEFALAALRVGILAIKQASGVIDSRAIREESDSSPPRSLEPDAVLADLQKARDNRRAQVGVFVFSRSSAPDGFEPLTRWGNDIVVVWDAEDRGSDVVFKAAISVARMIVVHEHAKASQATADAAEMRNAVETMCRDVALFEEVIRLAGNAKTNCDSIIKTAETLKSKIETHLDKLQQHVGGLTVAVAT